MSADSAGKRKFVIAGAVAFVVIASVAAIGVPAGWYKRAKVSVASQPSPVVTQAAAPAEVPATNPVETSPVSVQTDDAALAAKHQREKDREKAKAREEKAALTQAAAGSAPAATNVASEASKPGPKKITVTVTYDESGRVTQASGGDASAIRIARQKRFPAGKAGSATITIPIN